MQQDKYYSAEEMDNLISSIEYLCSKNKTDKVDFDASVDRFVNNETYKGKDATAAKEYMNISERDHMDSRIALQDKVLRLYKHNRASFAEKVDSAPNARIDTATLDLVQAEGRNIYFKLDSYCTELEKITDYLQTNYGHITTFSRPRTSEARAKFASLCGGDNLESGFIYEVKQKLIHFDEEECAYADTLMVDEDIADYKSKLLSNGTMLDGVKLFDPSVNAVVLQNIIFSDSIKKNLTMAMYGSSRYASLVNRKMFCSNVTSDVNDINWFTMWTIKKTIKYFQEGYKNYDKERVDRPGQTLTEMQQYYSEDLPDYTEEIDSWLEEQNKYFDTVFSVSYACGAVAFYNRVKTNGAMDIKQQKCWEEAFDNIPYPENQYFVYHDKVMDVATLGNITYAYVGAKWFSEDALLAGGAAVQVKRNDPLHLPMMFMLPHWGDAPEDYEAIKQGIDWYENGFSD